MGILSTRIACKGCKITCGWNIEFFIMPCGISQAFDNAPLVLGVIAYYNS